MNQESGRSLIEIIGVLAIAGVMSVATFGLYNMIADDLNQKDAERVLQGIAENTKLLWQPRGTYEGVSVDALKENKVPDSERAPIGGETWSITASADGQSFSINVVDLNYSDCEYFSIKKMDWANAVVVNGIESLPSGTSDNCFKTTTNQISFIVE